MRKAPKLAIAITGLATIMVVTTSFKYSPTTSAIKAPVTEIAVAQIPDYGLLGAEGAGQYQAEIDAYLAEQGRLEAVAEAKAEAEAKAKAEAEAAQAKARAEAAAKAKPLAVSAPVEIGSNRDRGHILMLEVFGEDQWSCLDSLWGRYESGWNVYADNPNSTAYGIPQALPGSKMGAGWQTDRDVQIKWGLNYIQNRYGTPCNALRDRVAKGWY